MRKIWRELQSGCEWVVDADLKNFFGTVDHDKLITLVAQRVSDGRVLGLIRAMLEAGCMAEDAFQPTTEGTPQGGIVSPLLSNVLLTPFDWEMRERGYRLTRYADDWLVTCRSRKEAEQVLAEAKKILTKLGVTLNEQKTRIVHITEGFEFLGYKVKRGNRKLRLPAHKIRTGAQRYSHYVYPTQKAIDRFKEQIRKLTRRKAGISVQQLIEDINPVIRGWGQYYCKAHVRGLFNRLSRWIVQRIWSYRFKRWRCAGYRELPQRRLYGKMGLVNLVSLIPSIASRR
jgi:group II intron reverse transcriptase/maturase